jgi:DNA-binding protein YbaB
VDDTGLASSDSSESYLDSLLAQTRELVDTITSLQEQVRSLTVTARSADRLVTAVAAAGGRIVDLELDPRVYREPDSYALADSILSAIEQAQDGVARREAEIRAKALPDAEALGGSVGLDAPELKRLFGPLARPRRDRDAPTE